MTAPPSPAKLRRLCEQAARAAADLGLQALEVEAGGVRVRVERGTVAGPTAMTQKANDDTAAQIDQDALDEVRRRLGLA